MQFKPKTQEEIDAENLCPEGDFPFTIKEASEKVSSSGKPYFKLKLFVHGDSERDWHVYDMVSPAFMAHKLLHLCEGTGLFPRYAAGTLDCADLLEKTGHCTVTIEEAKGGFAAKNVITDYIVPDRKEAMKNAKDSAAPQPEKDDVPF